MLLLLALVTIVYREYQIEKRKGLNVTTLEQYATVIPIENRDIFYRDIKLKNFIQIK